MNWTGEIEPKYICEYKDLGGGGACSYCWYTFLFYKQLVFSSQPGVANEFCENEDESCLAVAYFYS